MARVLKHNLTSVAILPFHKITLESKKRETSVILFWFSPDFNYFNKCANQKLVIPAKMREHDEEPPR